MVKRGFKGWEIEFSDGTTINEDQADWKNVPKIGINSVFGNIVHKLTLMNWRSGLSPIQ